MNKKITVIIALAVLIVAIVAIVVVGGGDNSETQIPPSELEQTFTWHFEESETSNLDGFPQTDIYLTATYDDEKIEKNIDTVDGGCSESGEDIYESDIPGVGSIQCYYAGLGQEYRITENNNVYFVERKLFEEALPDTTPPSYEWEVIAEFSFI